MCGSKGGALFEAEKITAVADRKHPLKRQLSQQVRTNLDRLPG